MALDLVRDYSGRSMDVNLVLDLVRRNSGRNVDVNLVLDLFCHDSGRSVDVILVVGWIKTAILMDLRQNFDKFSQLAWQAAKFDEMLTSILF